MAPNIRTKEEEFQQWRDTRTEKLVKNKSIDTESRPSLPKIGAPAAKASMANKSSLQFMGRGMAQKEKIRKHKERTIQ